MTTDDLERKEILTKGVLTKVIFKMKKMPRGFSPMVKKYIEVDNLLDSIKKERDKLNDDIKSKMKEIFEAEEAVLARVVETAEFTIQLSGDITPEPKPKVNHEAVLEEIQAHLTPELVKMLEEIKEKHTKVGQVQAVSNKLTYKVNESLTEGLATKIVDFIVNLGNKLKSKLKPSLEKFDNKLDSLKALV